MMPPDDQQPHRRPSRGATVAWRVAGGVMLIFALWWGIYSAVTAIAREEYTEVTTYAADDVDTLMAGTADGDVTIIAADGDEIVVTAEVTDGLRKTGNRQEIVGSELQLDGSCPVLGSQWCRVDYTVELPIGVDVRVDSGHGAVAVRGVGANVIDIETNHGGIEVEDVFGDVRLDVSHGSITATRLTANEVIARADHGDIDIDLDDVTPGTEIGGGASRDDVLVDAETDHGSIDVAVPDAGDAYVVDVDSDHGSETTAIRTDPDSDRTIRAVTDHGDVTVRYVG